MTVKRNRPLTAAMREALELIRDGWEPAASTGLTGHCWLQQGGAGYGGPSKDINAKTFWGLYDRGYLVPVGSYFPYQRYRLAAHDPS